MEDMLVKYCFLLQEAFCEVLFAEPELVEVAKALLYWDGWQVYGGHQQCCFVEYRDSGAGVGDALEAALGVGVV
ncbi:hypothetical protein [Hymenobacter daecheongensis]|uniref:hypothetical protein n=1 Tax=Hymenobacter daecheongensis TaxID=496053 RepID=UPI000932378F|nr:hypothetical protein [Hymenobacter daecheongensis]